MMMMVMMMVVVMMVMVMMMMMMMIMMVMITVGRLPQQKTPPHNWHLKMRLLVPAARCQRFDGLEPVGTGGNRLRTRRDQCNGGCQGLACKAVLCTRCPKPNELNQ